VDSTRTETGGRRLIRLVAASANPDKIREISEILASAGLETSVLSRAPEGGVEETGPTLEANALIKARHACAASGLPAVGDDTGLFVRGLGGGPGLYTSRYAGASCSYEDNVRKLLRALTWERGPSRIAVFRTAAALCLPGGGEAVVTGELEGIITTEPRGGGGFGYDPVFLVESLGQTLAECPAEVKNRFSHRSRALRLLVDASAHMLEKAGRS
jgi:XTP/dITP diphosphohydrolase